MEKLSSTEKKIVRVLANVVVLAVVLPLAALVLPLFGISTLPTLSFAAVWMSLTVADTFLITPGIQYVRDKVTPPAFLTVPVQSAKNLWNKSLKSIFGAKASPVVQAQPPKPTDAPEVSQPKS